MIFVSATKAVKLVIYAALRGIYAALGGKRLGIGREELPKYSRMLSSIDSSNLPETIVT